MSSRVVTTYIDDLTGQQFDPDSGEGGTVSFAINGAQYEIDLTTANQAVLQATLDLYINKGRRVQAGSVRDIASGGKATRRRGPTRRRVPAAERPKLSPELQAEIETWVVSGEVPDRVRAVLGQAHAS